MTCKEKHGPCFRGDPVAWGWSWLLDYRKDVTWAGASWVFLTYSFGLFTGFGRYLVASGILNFDFYPQESVKHYIKTKQWVTYNLYVIDVFPGRRREDGHGSLWLACSVWFDELGVNWVVPLDLPARDILVFSAIYPRLHWLEPRMCYFSISLPISSNIHCHLRTFTKPLFCALLLLGR